MITVKIIVIILFYNIMSLALKLALKDFCKTNFTYKYVIHYINMVDYKCEACKKTKTFTEMAYYYNNRPRILKTCDACRAQKKEDAYIKKFIKRHTMK
jgi:hypothetical protein